METKIFYGNETRYILLFAVFVIMFAFGIWLTFFITNETLSSFSRPLPFGTATGPIAMFLSGWLGWTFAPLPHRLDGLSLVLSPTGIRSGTFDLKWSEIGDIRETSFNDVQMMELVLVDPEGYWAGRGGCSRRILSTEPGIRVPDTYLRGSLEEVMLATRRYWEEHREGCPLKAAFA